MAHRRCIFCQNPARTREHLWSDWILRSLSPGRDIIQRIGKGSIRRFAGSVTVKCVCKECNNGWMSEIEVCSRPILGSMMHDLSVYLDRREQERLCVWATKTAMVLEGTKPQKARRCYPEKDCMSLRLKSSIPAGTRIWVGRFSESGLLAHGAEYSLNVGELPIIGHGCVATIIVGHLAVQVLSPFVHSAYHGKTISVPCKLGPWSQLLISIWPIDGTVSWPPNLSLTNDNGPLSYLRLRDRWKPE